MHNPRHPFTPAPANIPIMGSYKLEGPLPDPSFNVEVAFVTKWCKNNQYDFWLYPGLVLQMQPMKFLNNMERFFVSFTGVDDPYPQQRFLEASGDGHVFRRAELGDEAVKQFLYYVGENMHRPRRTK